MLVLLHQWAICYYSTSGSTCYSPLEALDPSPPGISRQSLQRSNPQTDETFTYEDNQNVLDVQSTSDKVVLTIDRYG